MKNPAMVRIGIGLYGIRTLFDGSEERSAHIREAFSHLTETQQRRILMLAAGMSIREIAARENTHHRAVEDSIQQGRKKFLKFF